MCASGKITNLSHEKNGKWEQEYYIEEANRHKQALQLG